MRLAKRGMLITARKERITKRVMSLALRLRTVEALWGSMYEAARLAVAHCNG